MNEEQQPQPVDVTPSPAPAPVESLEISPAPEAAPATAADVAKLQAELGEMRRRDAARQVTESLGGDEVVRGAMSWAQQNMTQAQLDAINSDMANASVDGQTAIMRGLVEQSGAGARPFAQGTAQPAGTVPFGSQEALLAAQRDPKYATDPQYRDEIMRRLSVSNL
jgi:hypothetical protein